MQIAALILGILGGLGGLALGFFGYTIGGLAGASGAVGATVFQIASIAIPVVILVGGGLALTAPSVAGGLMVVGAAGIFFLFGANFFTTVPLVLSALGGVLAWSTLSRADAGPSERTQDASLLVARLLMASLFLTAGIPKALQGYGGGFAKYLGGLGVPYPEIVGAVAVGIEVLVPIALILGVFPRISALLLIAFVIVATALAHRYWEFPEAQQAAQRSSFLKNVAIVGGLLFYYASGAGAWALAGRGERAGAGAHAARA